ncbi:MAG: fused MFS/spermidine synthase [Candidatus Micrarchaeota archaeon]
MDSNDRPLLLVVFISGACSLLVEIAGARVLAPYLGTTIYSWAAVIGVVLASLSIGYYAGGVLADRHHDKKHFSLILLSAGLSTLLTPFLGMALLPITLALDVASASLIGALIFAPASLFYGMVSPYAIKLTAKKGEEGKSSGSVFALSTVGSIMGAIGTGFVLIPNLPVTQIFILAAFLMLASSWAASGIRKESVLDALPFLAMSFLMLGAQLEPPVKGTVVYSGDSAYYHLRVIDTTWRGGPARVLFLDNAASSGERPDGEPAFEYVKTTRLAYEIPVNVSRALVIGSAAGTEMEELKRVYPDAQVDGVEIDEKAVSLGKEYFSFEDDNRTQVIIDDARRYVLRANATYDLVLIDAFRGTSLPYHLATKEYLSALRQKLSPDGLVVVNIISSVDGEKAGVLDYMHGTFSSVFSDVVIIPTGNDTGKLQNIVLIASDRDLSGFRAAHADRVYTGPVAEKPPLTDELNPIELYVAR